MNLKYQKMIVFTQQKCGVPEIDQWTYRLINLLLV